MKSSPRSRRGLGTWMAPAAMVALCASVVLGMSTGAGAATPTRSGASGSVASISGTTMEVQSASEGQTSVTWTPSTTFSRDGYRDPERRSNWGLPHGDGYAFQEVQDDHCRPVHHDQPALIVRFVRVGLRRCRRGRGARARADSAGASGDRVRASLPRAGAFGARRSFPGAGNFAIATGKVTAVKGSTISLSGTVLSQLTRPSSSKSKSTKKPTVKTQKLKVTTSSTTTLSETQSTTATALSVGDCVSTFGTASSTGAVTATTVRITSTGGQTCSTGFGGGGFGGGGFGGGGSSA